MELKKKPEADIKRRQGLYFSIGLVVSLSIVALAFEWKTYDEQNLVDLGKVNDNFEQIMDVPPTEQPPPEPPPKQPEIIEVPDEKEIEKDVDLNLDIEMTEETEVEEMVKENAPEEEETDKIFNVVEHKPQPKGGMSAFYNYVNKEMEYPNQARRMGIEGKVFVQFVVAKNGELTNVKVVKGLGAGLDKEAKRVVENAPRWEPGKQRGRPVKVRMVLPITFRLGK